MTRQIRTSREDPFAGSGARTDKPVALLIDDGQDEWVLPEEPFSDAGCRPVRSAGLTQAQEDCDLSRPDLVFMPLTLGGKLSNIQLLDCLSHDPTPVVVVVASNDQINAAAEAMRLGAYDCLFKPFSRSRLTRTIEAAVKKIRQTAPAPKRATRAARPLARPREPEATPAPQDRRVPAQPRRDGAGLNLARRGFVASSPPIQAVLDRATMVARSEAAVFLSGEVGTGKTTFADIVHHASPRAHGALVTLSCATLTARDFESQIYGPQGALARAAEGTLYLDEVTDLSAEVQSRIARVIESCAADPGAAAPRFIGSTVHAPNAALQKGLIRPELYYRLHVAPLHLPPLRDREGDAALIAQVRLAAFSETEGRGFTGFTDTALAMISAYHWPGNLRELVNAIQTIVLMNQGPLVTPELLPPEVRAGLRTNRDTGAGRSDVDGMRVASPAHSDNTPDALVGKTLAEIERTVIEATIAAEDGSVPRAARVLDVSPSTLYRKREAWAKALDDEA